MAATLEMIDLAFVSLRAEERSLIQRHAETYTAGKDLDVRLDSARLAGLMESDHPSRPGWTGGYPPPTAPPRYGARIVQALALGGITTAKQLRKRLRSTRTQNAIADYAVAYGTSPDLVSHTAILLIALGASDKDLLEVCFPSEAQDSPLQSALA